ncbi:hypothetical protein CRG98_008491 [Punica granatum]|uniref:Uncharacterized protein n=1 Tax=Punica granatum TaxID=22663 RepID=A0A2I0KS61_PUNGR|nr:hypothetical protein CRG98_008491 [Punica granatum]
MDPVLGGPDARPPKVPVSHVWAYRDVPDDALAVLLFVRHARRLWTLLNRVVSNYLDCVFCYPLCLRKVPSWTVEWYWRVNQDLVGIENLATSAWGSLVRTMCERLGGQFYLSLVSLSFCYGHPPRGRTFNLKGKSSPFATTAPKGFRSRLSFTLTFA